VRRPLARSLDRKGPGDGPPWLAALALAALASCSGRCGHGEHLSQPSRPARFVPLPAEGERPRADGDSAAILPRASRGKGCGTPHATPRGETHTLEGRTFHVWAPAGYDPSRPWPVVLAFHGWGMTGRGFQSWFKMDEHVAGAAVVVYPDSRTDVWDVHGATDLAFVEGMLARLDERYCIDRAQVLALGFSYGAKLVHHLACRRPDLVKAIVAGAGSHRTPFACVGKVPVLVIHRTRDGTEAVAGGRDAAERWREANGCGPGESIVEAEHECVGFPGCVAPGSVTYCEDTFFDPTWKPSYNHTVREEYRDLAWTWFTGLP